MVPEDRMQRIYLTIIETTLDRALERIASVPDGAFGVELRVDAFQSPPSPRELLAFRERVPRSLIYTRRTSSSPKAATATELLAALGAGFDYADVEVNPLAPAISDELLSFRDRLLLSHHDYDRLPAGVHVLAQRLAALGRFKIAASPRTLEENFVLLRLQREYGSRASIFGMGERGLYSRTLSPFFGGKPAFAAASTDTAGAPGQLTLEKMVSIIGEGAPDVPPAHLFAIAGKPVMHSQSPAIHNEAFRKHGVDAAYGLLQTDSIDEVITAMAEGIDMAPRGISVTAPFKESALERLQSAGARVSSRAIEAGAVNTVVRGSDGGIFGDNTDVSGFVELLRRSRVSVDDSRPVLIVGAGGTARAAAVAVRTLGLRGVIANRSPERAAAVALATGLDSIDWTDMRAVNPSVLIDTVPSSAGWSSADLVLRSRSHLITADYSAARAEHDDLRREGIVVFEGLDLLRAQAEEQSRIFLAACGAQADARHSIGAVGP